MNEESLKEPMEKVRTVIGATRRLGRKPGVALLRYHKALFMLKHWKTRAKIAQTKVRKYRGIVKRYQKKLGV